MIASRVLPRLSQLSTGALTSSRSMSFELSDQQREFQSVALQFAKDVIAPAAAHHDKTGEFPWDIIKKAHSLGLMNPQLPEKYGAIASKILLSQQLTFRRTWMLQPRNRADH